METGSSSANICLAWPSADRRLRARRSRRVPRDAFSDDDHDAEIPYNLPESGSARVVSYLREIKR